MPASGWEGVWGDGTSPSTAIARSELNEDWLRILRIQRVLSAAGVVLFDVEDGHADPRTEDALDKVNYEHLALLVDLTWDLYVVTGAIEVEPVGK